MYIGVSIRKLSGETVLWLMWQNIHFSFDARKKGSLEQPLKVS